MSLPSLRHKWLCETHVPMNVRGKSLHGSSRTFKNTYNLFTLWFKHFEWLVGVRTAQRYPVSTKGTTHSSTTQMEEPCYNYNNVSVCLLTSHVSSLSNRQMCSYNLLPETRRLAPSWEPQCVIHSWCGHACSIRWGCGRNATEAQGDDANGEHFEAWFEIGTPQALQETSSLVKLFRNNTEWKKLLEIETPQTLQNRKRRLVASNLIIHCSLLCQSGCHSAVDQAPCSYPGES